MNICFIVNGIRKAAHAALKELQEYKTPADRWEFRITERAGHAEELASDPGLRADLIVAVGGDGTFHQVINGVMNRPLSGRPRVALLPCGTGNDFARMMKWKRNDVNAFLTRLRASSWMEADLGKVTAHEHGVRYFINVADAGIGAAVVGRVQSFPRQFPRWLAFPVSIFRTFPVFQKPLLEIQCGSWSYSGKVLTVVAANGMFFGSGICIAPEASPSNGTLEFICIGDVSVLDYLRHLPKLRRGERIIDPRVHYIRGTRIIIGGNSSTETDGEEGPALPVTIEVLPGEITLLT